MRLASPAYTTPPELAKQWGVAVNKVLGFIDTGELVAINLATSRKGRPRWKISAQAIADFELRRQSLPASPAAPRRAKKQPASRVIQFV